MHPHKVKWRYGLSKWMEKGMLCFVKKRKKSHVAHKRSDYRSVKFIMVRCFYMMEILVILYNLRMRLFLINGQETLKRIRVK